jgi:hypothetical protein
MGPRKAKRKQGAKNKAKDVVLDELDNHESESEQENFDYSAKKRKSDEDEDEFGQPDSLKRISSDIEDESDDFACFEDEQTIQKPNALYSAQISTSSTTPTSTISSILTTTPPIIHTTEKVSNGKRIKETVVLTDSVELKDLTIGKPCIVKLYLSNLFL